MKIKLKESYADTIKYRINNDDDLLVIRKNGEVLFKGIVDDVKDDFNDFDDFKFDEARKLYTFTNDLGDEYTVEKIIVEDKIDEADNSEVVEVKDTLIQDQDKEVLADEVIAFLYKNYPELTYTGAGELKDGRSCLKFDKFSDEVIDALFKEFGRRITITQCYSEYAPELKKACVILNEEETSGTQVTDIEKKVDYPTFKIGKKISSLIIPTEELKEDEEVKDIYEEIDNLIKSHDKGEFQARDAEEIIDEVLKSHNRKDLKEEIMKKYYQKDYVNSLKEDEVIDNLEPEEKEQLNSILNDRIIRGYKCKNCKRTIPNITFFDRKIYKDRTEYFCPFCGEPYDFEDLKDIELTESDIDSLADYEVYDKAMDLASKTTDSNLKSEINNLLDKVDKANKRGAGYADKHNKALKEILKKQKGIKEAGEFFNLYKSMNSLHNISKYTSPDELKKFLDNARAKNYDHPVAGGISEKDYEVLLKYANDWQNLIDNCGYMASNNLKESYNYIGTDVDEEPRDDKSHKERIFTVYDQFGEIGEYPTREEAQKVIDEWYNDPELYGDEGAQLRIEEDIVDVLNKKIVKKDDLAS